MDDIACRGVGIYRHNSEELVGSGFIYSEQYVLTCTHVLSAAVENDGHTPPEIQTRFKLQVRPELFSGNEEASATLIDYRPVNPKGARRQSEDIALLKLDTKLAPETPALTWSRAKPEQQLKVYGFGVDEGDFIEGQYQGEASDWDKLALSEDCKYLDGFSGGLVMDSDNQKAVGMAVFARGKRAVHFTPWKIINAFTPKPPKISMEDLLARCLDRNQQLENIESITAPHFFVIRCCWEDAPSALLTKVQLYRRFRELGLQDMDKYADYRELGVVFSPSVTAYAEKLNKLVERSSQAETRDEKVLVMVRPEKNAHMHLDALLKAISKEPSRWQSYLFFLPVEREEGLGNRLKAWWTDRGLKRLANKHEEISILDCFDLIEKQHISGFVGTLPDLAISDFKERYDAAEATNPQPMMEERSSWHLGEASQVFGERLKACRKN